MYNAVFVAIIKDCFFVSILVPLPCCFSEEKEKNASLIRVTRKTVRTIPKTNSKYSISAISQRGGTFCRPCKDRAFIC